MNLELPIGAHARYKSRSQQARVSTEPWAAANLFCPNCPAPRLEPTDSNTQAIDFVCARCEETFQLKSQGHFIGRKIVDAAYSAMMRALEGDRAPNLFALHYDSERWRVENLILIPRFSISTSAIEKRKPLGPNARRAGWVGCNIVLDLVPDSARIIILSDGEASRPSDVRARYRHLRPLANLSVATRGWTLDVLNVVRSLGREEFSLDDVYTFAGQLARLHPANRHIRPKIRQQLQILRDLGFVKFLGGGRYRR